MDTNEPQASPEPESRAFERLKRRYIESLPAKLQQLRRDWESATGSGWQEAALLQLKNGVHRLAGSAGSYGFPELTSVARALENRLEAVQLNPDEPEPASRAGLEYRRLLELLRAPS